MGGVAVAAKRYDDQLATGTIYAAENAVAAMLDRGGLVDFHGSLLALDGCRVRRYTPQQVPLIQGMIGGLWRVHGTGGPPPSLRASARAGGGRAWYNHNTREIVLPTHSWAWNDLVILHELSHACTGVGGDQRSSHGHTWRKNYCSLVSEVIGPEAGLLLMDALAI